MTKPSFILKDDFDDGPSRGMLLLYATVILAIMGFIGHLDFMAEKEMECASKRYVKMTYDREKDRCVPVKIKSQVKE